jgi:hypothetical protein
MKVPWKKFTQQITVSENSVGHLNHTCYCEWKKLQQFLKSRRIDSDLQKLILCEAEKWEAILKRVRDVTVSCLQRFARSG